MTKRILGGLFLLMGVPLVVLLIWQPDSVKKYVLSSIVREISSSSPYEISIGRVTGNVFTGFALGGVRVLSKSDHSEVLRAKTIQIGVDWWALLHRRFRIRRLDWIDPVVVLHWPLPTHTDETPRKPLPFTYSIRRLTIEGGRIDLLNDSSSPAKQVSIHDILLSARVGTKQVRIDRFEMGLGGGRAHGEGLLNLQRDLSGHFQLQDHSLPLDQILDVIGAASPFPLPHSGQWAVQAGSGTVKVNMKGELAAGPISLQLFWKPLGIEQVHLTWPKPGILTASLNISKGAGPFRVVVSSGAARGVVEGEMTLQPLSVRGHGLFTQVAWKQQRTERIDATFSASSRTQNVEARLANVRFQEKTELPYDVVEAHWVVKGSSPRWNSDLSLRLRNGASIDLTGRLIHGSDFWRWASDRFNLAFASGGIWKAAPGGSLSWGQSQEIRIRQMDLSNGNQSVKLPYADLSKKYVRFSISA